VFQAFKNIFKAYFVTGLLVLGPLVISIYIVKAIVDAADSALQTQKWLPFEIPGLGFILALVIILLSGFLAKNVFGRFLFASLGDLITRVPVVGGVYSSSKQIFEALFGGSKGQFGRVVMIQYPHPESWTLAFVTSETVPKEVKALQSNDLISVYVPTSPNPTSGFYLYVPRAQALDTQLSVEQAFKIILSLGMVQQRGH
jgi:uncharacterized membrane protein